MRRLHRLALVLLVVLVAACGIPSTPVRPTPEPVPPGALTTPAVPSATPPPTANPAARATQTPLSAAVASPTPAPPAPTQPPAAPTQAPPAPTATVPPALPAKPAPAPTPTAVPAPADPAAAGLPKRLRVPRLRIDAPVEYVGLDAEGAMDVPKGYDSVAWYKLGPRPGDVGSAVMAGHLDSKTGPAVFWRLRDLKPGDDVIVISDDGKERRFRVTETVAYRFDEAPLERIFAAPEGVGLNLITCGGTFDRRTQNYDQRIVVYTTLVA